MQVVEYAKKNSEALELIFDAKSAYKILRTENWHFATLCSCPLKGIFYVLKKMAFYNFLNELLVQIITLSMV